MAPLAWIMNPGSFQTCVKLSQKHVSNRQILAELVLIDGPDILVPIYWASVIGEIDFVSVLEIISGILLILSQCFRIFQNNISGLE